MRSLAVRENRSIPDLGPRICLNCCTGGTGRGQARQRA